MVTETCDALVTNRTRTHRQYIVEGGDWKKRLQLKLKTEK